MNSTQRHQELSDNPQPSHEQNMTTTLVHGSVLARRAAFIVPARENSTDDGVTLRQYQIDIALDQAEYLLAVLPTGAGKSVAMISHAQLRFNQGLSTIIIVPTNVISSACEKYAVDKDFVGLDGEGVEFVRVPRGSIIHPDEKGKTILVGAVLNSRPVIVVCCYQTFINAYPSLTAAAKARLKVLVDEAHHVGFHPDPDEGTKLAVLVDAVIDENIPVWMFTATDFRTDRLPLIPPGRKDKFVTIKRTLAEHYQDGYSPDFDIRFAFYDGVTAQERDAMDSDDRGDDAPMLGDIDAMIDGYINAYRERPIPTLMLVPATIRTRRDSDNRTAAMVAKDLANRIKQEFPQAAVLNLGSEDGVRLESTQPDVAIKYARLNAEERVDIVVAIKTMDEGSDWPDCAQVFLPSVPGSFGLILQRVGRSLRKKRSPHPSPDRSHVVFFEVGLRDDDRPLVTAALGRLAMRLKCICNGMAFVAPWTFEIDADARDRVDKFKKDVNGKLDTQQQFEIDQQLNQLANAGADPLEIVTEFAATLKGKGVTLDEASGVACLEMLVAKQIVVEPEPADKETIEKRIREQSVRRLNTNSAAILHHEFAAMHDIIDGMRVEGTERYISMLNGGDGTLEEIRQRLWKSAQKEWDIRFAELVTHVEKHGKVPPQTEPSIGSFIGWQRTHKKHGRLTAVQIAKLEAIPGWRWDSESRSDIFDKGFERVKSIYQAGNRPQRKSPDASFVNRQRLLHRKPDYPAEWAARMESLPGWEWDPIKGSFDRQLKALIEYRNQTGKMPPASHSNKTTLGGWPAAQRHQFRKGRLSDEQIAALNEHFPEILVGVVPAATSVADDSQTDPSNTLSK